MRPDGAVLFCSLSYPAIEFSTAPALSNTARNLYEHRQLVRSQEVPMHKDKGQIVETATEARGGLPGRPVLLVLIVSCVLAVAGLIITYSGS